MTPLYNDPTRLYLILCRNLHYYLLQKPTTHEISLATRRTLVMANDLAYLLYYLPALSHTIDYEDLMAKNNNNFNLLDYRLSEAELGAYEAWLTKTKPTMPQCLSELAAMDIKISLTFVENSESWCVSITGKEGNKFNEKVTMTNWSDDVEDALYMACYKAVVVFERGKWIGKAKNNRG